MLRQKFTDVSAERNSTTFTLEEWAKQQQPRGKQPTDYSASLLALLGYSSAVRTETIHSSERTVQFYNEHEPINSE
jgi:hypothetical protein